METATSTYGVLLNSDNPVEAEPFIEVQEALAANSSTIVKRRQRRSRVARELSGFNTRNNLEEVLADEKCLMRTIQTRGRIRSYVFDVDIDDEGCLSPLPKRRSRKTSSSAIKSKQVKVPKPRRRRKCQGEDSLSSSTMIIDSLSGKSLPWTLAALSLHMNTNEAALEFCQNKLLLPRTKKCPVCHEDMIYSEKLSSDKGLGYVFRCSRRACQIVRSARSGTWFERSKLPIRKSLLLTYCFATDFPFGLAVHESSFTSGCTSPTTVSDWYRYCREVCVSAMKHHLFEKLGGSSEVIEMDTIMLGEKYKGRQKGNDGQMILGLYCRCSNKVALFCIPRNKKDSSTVVPIIEDHVKSGSWIHTSCLQEKEILEPGYQHLVSSYQIKIVALKKGEKNSGLDKICRALKSFIMVPENSRRPDQLSEHLSEFLWRRWVDLNKLDPFAAFLNDAAALYTVMNEDSSIEGNFEVGNIYSKSEIH